jgi:hypothetical protein
MVIGVGQRGLKKEWMDGVIIIIAGIPIQVREPGNSGECFCAGIAGRKYTGYMFPC